MLTKRKKQDVWLTQEQYDALQTLEDGVVYHITNAKVDYSTEVSNRPILKTNNTTAQATSASETITGTINLHKIAKTGTSTDLTDSSDLVRSSAFSTLQGKVTTIESEIPSEASSSNQLADKNFVNSSINSISAYYITRNASGDPFGTKAQLTGASTFYSGGSVRVPTKNDYCIVLADESQGTTVSGYTSFTTTAQYVGYFVIYNNEGIEVTSSNKDSVGITAGTTVAYEDLPTTRYIYQGTQWDFQYKVNDTPLTAQQLSTLNSGFTASDKATFDNMVNNPPMSLPIGTIIPVALVSNDSGLHLVNGASLSQSGTYSAFCSFLKDRITANVSNVPTCSIDEYAADMDFYGQCGKFVINDTNSDIINGTSRKSQIIRYQGYRLNSSGGMTSESGSSVIFVPTFYPETLSILRANSPTYNYIRETSDYGTTFTSVYNGGTPTFSTNETYTIQSPDAKYLVFTIKDTDYDTFNVYNANTQQSVLANSIKLPTITEFIASNNNGQSIGIGQLDTFKSHNHIAFMCDEDRHSGELTYGNNITSNTANYQKILGAEGYAGWVSANPTIYSGTTGDAETRPKNIRYPYYIVVGTTTRTNIQINIDNILNDLQNKADKDASNLSDTNVASWNTKLGNDWHTFSGTAGTNITVPVGYDKVKEFSFRVLGGDSGTFGYISIPKDIWAQDGAYGIVLTPIDTNGYQQGHITFAITNKQTNSFQIASTNYGTTGGFVVAVKY